MKLKGVLDMLKEVVKIRGKTKLETLENIFTLLLFSSSISLSIFIGIASVVIRGWPVVGIMLSSLLIFVSLLSLIIIWIVKEE
ncbi:MAG: hypothetical protein LM587_01350 [Candidatus Aenigmarchaeota archaeon]|nr:hypothetical protein [Candidatus Aenigmarchaeota archaeon]